MKQIDISLEQYAGMFLPLIHPEDLTRYQAAASKECEHHDWMALPAFETCHKITAEDRLLVAVYGHLYTWFRTGTAETSALFLLRERMGVPHLFAQHFTEAIEQIDASLRPEDPLDIIIDPPDPIITWAQVKVNQMHMRGHYLEKIRLSGLSYRWYEHPLDKSALNALEGTPGLEGVARAFIKYGIEEWMIIKETGNNHRVTERAFPDVHRALLKACDILDVDPIPELYIKNGYLEGSYTIGDTRNVIVITSAMPTLFTQDELLFVLGHELGHIKSNHTLYYNMAEVVPLFSKVATLGLPGLGTLLNYSITAPLLYWKRRSEYTADRAGLLCCQNLDAAITVMMKLAGTPIPDFSRLDPETFLQQAEEFKGFDENDWSKAVKGLSMVWQDHPWIVDRAKQLASWEHDGSMQAVLDKVLAAETVAKRRGDEGSAIRHSRCQTSRLFKLHKLYDKNVIDVGEFHREALRIRHEHQEGA
jgi:Zn-dependent protease with chaperone function